MLENRYWALEPRDSFLDINQDDIDEMMDASGADEPDEPCSMTLAKAKKEEEMLDEQE